MLAYCRKVDLLLLKARFMFFRPVASSLSDSNELQGCLETGRTAMVNSIFYVFIAIAFALMISYFSFLLSILSFSIVSAN